MNTLSQVPAQALLAAYLGAVYRIGDGEDAPRIRIGETVERVPDAGRVHALLTACNPRSESLPAQRNARRMQDFRGRLAALAVDWTDATGSSPDGAWHEPSCWLRNIAPETVDALAAEFGQNASVVVGADARAVLHLHRSDWRAVIGDDARWRWPAQRGQP